MKSSYEELLDKMEEKNKYLSVLVKQLQQEVNEWRGIANALAHVSSLSLEKHPPLWAVEKYRQWESMNKGWWGV